MKQNPAFPAVQIPAPSTVTVLRCATALALDPEPLAVIFAEQGEDAAEETVCRALEDLARRLDGIQDTWRRGAFDELTAPAGRISVIADQIGLLEIAASARHVATACKQRDGIAVEATLQRLERAFDAAVSQVWHFRELF